ncbi:MAG: TraR/DksA C4-type zinc finger protein [Candidatus Solibacter sp.]
MRFRDVLEAKQYELERILNNRAAIAIEQAADAIDEFQHASERDVAISNLDRDSRLLLDVRLALRRTKDGTFGVCLHCEEEISSKRLTALPWAPNCIVCQERADRDEGDRGEFGRRFEYAA